MTTRRGSDGLCTEMATSTSAIGRTISQMAKEPTSTWMEPITRVIGSMTNTTVREKNIGQMGPFTRASTARVKNTAGATLNGKMAAVLKAHLSIIAWRVKVHMSGTI